jgi:type IV pilus assembly protein PilA
MMRINRNSKGFTLIELLIVVAIIGILAAIAIPAYSGYTKKARVAGVVHAMGAIKNAVAAYYVEAGGFSTAGFADAAAIRTGLGVDVPTQYISTAAVAATTGAVSCTLRSIGAGVDNGTLTITPDPTEGIKRWTWSGSNGIEETYIPKN